MSNLDDLTQDKLTKQILENQMKHITIIGVWGLLDTKLVDPATPKSEPIIIYENWQRDEHCYIVSEDKVVRIKFQTWSHDNEDEYIIPDRMEADSWVKDEIKKYLVGDNVVIQRVKPTDVGNFSRLAMPLIRKVYPKLIANDLISVQPMTAPAGVIAYLKTKYGEQK